MQKRVSIERPEMPIIFITGHGDVRTTVQAMKAGASEFLTKPFRDDVMLSAIREALERSRIALGHEAEMSVLRDCYASLSSRERQVMGLVVSGLLNKQVGGELGISEITVKAHRGQVMQKMKAGSLADLVRKAGGSASPGPEILTFSIQLFSARGGGERSLRPWQMTRFASARCQPDWSLLLGN